jgi:hypothetical protein
LTELNSCLIRRPRHFSAQGVDLLDQVAFGEPSNGRIAGHKADLIDILRDQEGRVSHPGTGQRGFDSGMAATHHDHIVIRIGPHHLI